MSLPYSSTMAAEDAEKRESAAEEHARCWWTRCTQNLQPAATSSRASRSRTRSRWSWPRAAPPTRCCTGSPSRTPRACRWTLDDFERMRQQGAGAVRPEALGALRRGGPAPRRRHPAGDEDPARARRAARRLHDHHRQDGRGEPRRTCPPSRAQDQDVIRPWSNPMYAQGHLAILQRQPRARRLRGQDHGPEEARRSPGPRACSSPSPRRWTRSSPTASSPATCS